MKPSTQSPLRPSEGGYAKGEQTRARLLEAALDCFGPDGFERVTTRQIATRAGVNLPALTYYFGSKEGLYLACAQHIAGQYSQALNPAAVEAQAALDAGLPPAVVGERLKGLMAALAGFLLASSDAVNRNLFIQREMANRGPAFDLLYDRLWGPGIEFAAVLVERAAGGRLTPTEAGVRAALMIASLAGFGEGRAVIERAISKSDRIDYAIAALNEQIDALVRPPSATQAAGDR